MRLENFVHSLWREAAQGRGGLMFAGSRHGAHCLVTVDGVELPPRFDLRRHSPAGYEWGYQGSGPAQLALAILAAQYVDEVALCVYQRFKCEVVLHFDREGWRITSETLDSWLCELLRSAVRLGAAAT